MNRKPRTKRKPYMVKIKVEVVRETSIETVDKYLVAGQYDPYMHYEALGIRLVLVEDQCSARRFRSRVAAEVVAALLNGRVVGLNLRKRVK